MIDKNNIKKQCTFLVSSCDKYEEAWHPYFSLLMKNWPDCPFDVVLSTESKKYTEYNVRTINKSGNWGERLIYVLNEIQTPYVIFSLEDFFLQRKVRSDRVVDCLEFMMTHCNVACIYFNRISGYCVEPSDLDGFTKMVPNDEYNEYILNCQMGLWNKDFLIRTLKKIEDPWSFEVKGYKYNKEIIDKYLFYCSSVTRYDAIREEDIFSYLCERRLGYGIWRSKWEWNNRKLFEENDIVCDFCQLKTMSRFEYLCSEELKQWLIKIKQYLKMIIAKK